MEWKSRKKSRLYPCLSSLALFSKSQDCMERGDVSLYTQTTDYQIASVGEEPGSLALSCRPFPQSSLLPHHEVKLAASP